MKILLIKRVQVRKKHPLEMFVQLDPNQEPGEMVGWVKRSPCKHEDHNLDPQSPPKC